MMTLGNNYGIPPWKYRHQPDAVYHLKRFYAYILVTLRLCARIHALGSTCLVLPLLGRIHGNGITVHQHGPASYCNVVHQLDIKLHFTGTLTNIVFSVDVEDQDSNLEFPNA